MADSPLEWKNLKNMKCPKCECKLIENRFGYECSAKNTYFPCDFTISEEAFDRVADSLYNKEKNRRKFRIVSEEENLHGLNNL